MKMGNTVYKIAVGLALATPLLLVWMIGAVGVLGHEGDTADLMYIGVFAVGIICAIAARFRPAGMARALFATALAQALVAAIALIAGLHHAPYMSVREILGFNGFFIALWITSALLFRYASRERSPAGAAPGD